MTVAATVPKTDPSQVLLGLPALLLHNLQNFFAGLHYFQRLTLMISQLIIAVVQSILLESELSNRGQ